MNSQIRKMQPEDIDKAAQIFHAAFNSVGEKWDLPTAKKRLLQYFNPDTCWVAVEDSKIIGLLTGKIDNVLDHQELYIDIIAVDPELHQKGIGQQLLTTAEEFAKEQDLGGMWLCASTKIPSFDWYIRTGFRETSWVTLFKKI